MKLAIITAIIILLLAGCAQKSPDIVCNSPYMRFADGCCMDKDKDRICDDDEKDKPLFVEPDYVANDVPDVTYPEQESQDEQAYEVTSPTGEKTTATYVGQKDIVITVPTKYQESAAKLQGWKVSNSHMSFEVKKIVIDVNDIEKVSRTAPDKEVYLKEMQLEIRNVDYNYLNPVLYLKVGDSKDPIIIKETMLCDASDDIVMQGCKNALPESETMYVTMAIDRVIPRAELDKTFLMTFENKRDDDPKNMLELEKSYNILDVYGAEYI